MAKVRKYLDLIEPYYVGLAFGAFLTLEYQFYTWQFWALIFPVVIIWLIIREMARGGQN